jgi:hypothetical protein
MIKIYRESEQFFIQINKKFLIENGYKESILQNDTALLYHGTSIANSKKILSTGILRYHPFLSPDESESKRFSLWARTKSIVIPMIVYLGSVTITGGYFTSLQERLIRDTNEVWK